MKRVNKWDKEADVVIVGFGAAGATAAITAHDEGAKAIILEKNPEGGGNSANSGGSIRTVVDMEKAVEHYYICAEGTTPREVYWAYVREQALTPDWLRSMGAELRYTEWTAGNKEVVVGLGPLHTRHLRSAFPYVPGAEGVGEAIHVAGESGVIEPEPPGGAGGKRLFGLLSRQVYSRGVEVLTEHPARRLIQDDNGRVIGIEAEGPGGTVHVKARRAVVMTLGGFENNPDMHWNYLGTHFLLRCNPGNTGDGIPMVLEVGADLWHMNAVVGEFGYKVPEFETTFDHKLYAYGFLYVDQLGKRFMDEIGTDNHAQWTAVMHIDIKTLKRPRVPFWVIFDDDTRRAGHIGRKYRPHVAQFYTWSDDNLAEVEKGWILKADTLAELADKIPLPKEVVLDVVARYNMHCYTGYDPDFDRHPDSLVPVATSPFYAIAIWPHCTNTQGGGRRNARGQIVSVRGEPIKGLYSAGEFGSIWGRFYTGSNNISECLAFGRIAGRNAAAEDPWE